MAAAREAQASQPGSRNEPTVPFQDPAREAQATRQAAEAGGGGSGGRAPVGAPALSAGRILGGCSGSHSGSNESICGTRLMEPITG